MKRKSSVFLLLPLVTFRKSSLGKTD